MLRAIKLAILKHRSVKANKAANAYRSTPGNGWDVRVQIALDRRETAASNAYAKALDPNALLRAF